jgi:hypothetical protein
MAAKKVGTVEQSTVKVRIIDFELSGSDQSLQESLQTIATALSRGSSPVPVARRLGSATTVPSTNAVSSDEAEEVVDHEEENQVLDIPKSPTVERKSPTSPKKPTVVKVLHDISFTDASPSLKEFYDSKNPAKVVLANYLVIAYWFKNFTNIHELTADHFHTAFRHVGFPTPKDARQPMRDLKNSRDGRMMNGSAPNTAIISHLGENYVNAMGKVG